MIKLRERVERRIQRRSRALQVTALLALLIVAWRLGLPSLEPSQRPSAVGAPQRGRILSADGRILAATVQGERRHPQGSLAGALLGFTGTDGGLEGLEAAYDARLARGDNLRLTLDVNVQQLAEAVLGRAVAEEQAEWGAVVVLERATGRVLALAGAPAFRPDDWRAAPPSARRNRPLLEAFEPGSVVKALVVAALLNEGRTTPDAARRTPMRRAVGGAVISDAVPHPPVLSTRQVLRYSSNVGMTQLVQDVPAELLATYFTRFGLGRAVPLGPISSARGVLGDARAWGELGKATRAFGQGMSVNALQLAAAFNVLANDGRYVTPRLVDDPVASADRPVLRSAVARDMRRVLHSALEEGLARRAEINGYHSAGKTGTAQVAVAGGYSASVFTSTFAGVFPVDDPRVTVAVAVRGAKRHYQGSQLAAPIFRDIVAGLASQWAMLPER